MRILALTAGAARMYCGSCLRDNTLAAELKRQGHHVTLLPLYTPTRTDEPNVSEPHGLPQRHQRVPLPGGGVLPPAAPAPRPPVGRALDAPSGVPNFHPRQPAFARRHDGLHAARRGRLSAQGHSQVDRLPPHRGTARHLDPAQFSPHRPGAAHPRRARPAGRLHLAGRGTLPRPVTGAVSVAGAGTDPRQG